MIALIFLSDRMFITEKQLVKKLRSNYSSICDWNTAKFETSVLEEVNLGFGVADLVISKVISRKKKTSVSLSYFDIIVYKIIESSTTVSLDRIKEITKANNTKIKKSLEKLMIESYVNEQDALFTVKRSYQSITNKSVAIEAKLKDWKRALNQAFRYKWFASKSFVVLDSKFINPALVNISKFQKFNVGLAELNKKGELTIHFKPKAEKPIDDKMWMLLNEQVRSYLLGK